MTMQLQYVHIYTECLLNPVQIIKSYKPLLKRYLALVEDLLTTCLGLWWPVFAFASPTVNSNIRWNLLSLKSLFILLLP